MNKKKKEVVKERRKKAMELHRSRSYHRGATDERAEFGDFFDREFTKGWRYIPIKKLQRFKRGRTKRFKEILEEL